MDGITNDDCKLKIVKRDAEKAVMAPRLGQIRYGTVFYGRINDHIRSLYLLTGEGAVDLMNPRNDIIKHNSVVNDYEPVKTTLVVGE